MAYDCVDRGFLALLGAPKNPQGYTQYFFPYVFVNYSGKTFRRKCRLFRSTYEQLNSLLYQQNVGNLHSK